VAQPPASQKAPAEQSAGARASGGSDKVPPGGVPASGAGNGRAWPAALLALALPGAGHFYLGRRGRGAAMAACVLGCLLVGLAIDGRFYSLGEPAMLYKLGGWGELGLGPLYFILRLAGLAYQPGSPLSLSGTAGNGAVFLISAGLMNYLMAMDAFDLAIGRKR